MSSSSVSSAAPEPDILLPRGADALSEVDCPSCLGLKRVEFAARPLDAFLRLLFLLNVVSTAMAPLALLRRDGPAGGCWGADVCWSLAGVDGDEPGLSMLQAHAKAGIKTHRLIGSTVCLAAACKGQEQGSGEAHQSTAASMYTNQTQQVAHLARCGKAGHKYAVTVLYTVVTCNTKTSTAAQPLPQAAVIVLHCSTPHHDTHISIPSWVPASLIAGPWLGPPALAVTITGGSIIGPLWPVLPLPPRPSASLMKLRRRPVREAALNMLAR